MQRQNVKRILLVVLCLSVLLLGGAYPGYRKYVSLRDDRLIKQAHRYFDQSDTARARLCLQRVLGHNPKNLEACRLMAQLTESSHSPSALIWRSRVVELNPRSLDDRLELARTAMVLRDFPAAANALEGVLPEDKKRATYHSVAGAVAAAENQFAQAEMHFLEAARIEPANMGIQLSLAVVQLNGTNTEGQSQARTTLRFLASSQTNSAFRSQALRELVIDAVHSKHLDVAMAMSGELLRQTNSVFKDRFLRLEVLREAGDAEFKPALAACQREAAQNQNNLYELAMWEMLKISPSEPLAWLNTVPANVRTNQPVALLIAECDSMEGNWPELQSFLEHQKWGDLEFVRHAFQARAFRGQNLSASAAGQWEQALKLANGQKASLGMLLRLAAQWNWPKEAEDILWTIVNEYPGEKWALKALAQTLFIGGRTRSLMLLYSQETKRTPSDLAAENGLVVTALLLDAQEVKPQELARELYKNQPTNPVCASAYAFALYMRTNNTEALKVLEQLDQRDLEKPSLSGCYGLVLRATGNVTKARKYLDIASKTTLLPEERRLIEKARAGT